MKEPTTPTGKLLWDVIKDDEFEGQGRPDPGPDRLIDIEVEAANAERQRLYDKHVKGWYHTTTQVQGQCWDCMVFCVCEEET